MNDFSDAEKIIGYTFKDKNLLQKCFTHTSYSNENKNFESNERLEFLGDSVLGFIVTEYLFKTDNGDEGRLTDRKKQLVSKKPLSQAIIKNGLYRYILLGNGENSKEPNINLSENLFEALVAGIYLDGGLQHAKKFIFSNINSEKDDENFKGILQEYIEKNKLGVLKYTEIEKNEIDGKPKFKIGVNLNGKQLAIAERGKKKDAQKECARLALEILTKNKKTLS